MAAANEGARARLDLLGIKYSFSGPSFAAYHAGFDPAAHPASVSSKKSVLGDENEENPSHHIVMNTFAVPFRGDVNIKAWETTEKHGLHGLSRFEPQMDGKARILKTYADRNASGEVEDCELQKVAKNTTKLDLVKLTVPEVKDGLPVPPERGFWVFRVPVGHELHAHTLTGIVQVLGLMGPIAKPTLEKYWLPVPLSAHTVLETSDEKTLRDVERDLESSAWAVLNECSVKEPYLFDEQVVIPDGTALRERARACEQTGALGNLIFGPVRPPHMQHEETQDIAS